MCDMIQTLESRRLLSVTIPSTLLSAISQADSDGQALKMSLLEDKPVINADLAGINSAFHGLSNASQDRGLLAALRKAEATAMVVLKGDMLKIGQTGGTDLRKSLIAIAKFKAHPTNTTLQAAATTSISNFQNALTSMFNKFGTDITAIGASVSSDLAAIQSANSSVPAVQTADSKLQSDFMSESTSLQTRFQALNTDLQNLVTDLTALV